MSHICRVVVVFVCFVCVASELLSKFVRSFVPLFVRSLTREGSDNGAPPMSIESQKAAENNTTRKVFSEVLSSETFQVSTVNK